MEAKDLRIGNVCQRKDGTPFRVSLLDIAELAKEDPCFHVIPRPIELTEELLIKCGLKKYGYDSSFKMGDFIIRLYQGEYHLCVHGESGLEFVSMPFKHLHTLQNMYYVIEGEELTIKDI